MANLTHREYIKQHGDLTVERMEALIDLWELVENERASDSDDAPILVESCELHEDGERYVLTVRACDELQEGDELRFSRASVSGDILDRTFLE